MSFTVQIRVLGIPCEVQGSIDPADRSVGIMSDALEDVTFHNVKNGSRLKWLETKVETLDKWAEVNEAIWKELDRQARDSYPEPDDY